MPSNEQYLGDGLYASCDGWMVTLRAPRDGGDHYVCLEPEVYAALINYVEWLKRQPPGSSPDTREEEIA